MRGVSLDEISAATRISTRFLEAIERDQWEQLPGGVFNRGFIRSIARFLGLDEDSLVAEYSLGSSHAAPARPAVTPSTAGHMPRNYRPAVMAIALIVFVLGAGACAWRYKAPISSWIHAEYLAARAGGRVEAVAKLSLARTNAALDGASLPAMQPAPAVLTLKLQASKPADVKVSADGKIIFDGAVRPGDSRQFDAQDTFEIATSESSAVALELNGQALPPFGTPGVSGRVTLTREDLQPAVGGSH